MSVCIHTVSHPPNPFLIKMVMNFFALCWRKETRVRKKKKWLFEGWKYSQIILFFGQWPSWGLQENSHQSPIFLDWLATSYLGNAGSDLEESQKTKKPRKGDLMQCGTWLPSLMTFRMARNIFFNNIYKWEVHLLHTWVQVWHCVEGAFMNVSISFFPGKHLSMLSFCKDLKPSIDCIGTLGSLTSRGKTLQECSVCLTLRKAITEIRFHRKDRAI